MFNKNWSFWSDNRIFIGIICLLIVVVGIYEKFFLPVGLVILIGAYYVSRKIYKNKEAWFNRYLDTVVRNIERANNYAVQQLPIGIAVFESDGKLQWKNEMFQRWNPEAQDGDFFHELIPAPDDNFETLLNKDTEKSIMLDDRYFIMSSRRILTQENGDGPTGVVIYLMDVTEQETQKQQFDNNQLCLINLQFDNYSDVMKGLNEATKAAVLVAFHKVITDWVDELQGFFIKGDEDMYYITISKEALLECIDHKFAVIDHIREIKAGNKIPLTISISAACEEPTILALGQKAQSGLDLALGRGGDQAVVSLDGETQFFGGNNLVQAKSTRVRARIVAQAIHELMLAADKIFVMGHANEDYDALGSAIGVAKMAFSLSKEAYIVTSGQGYSLQKMVQLAKAKDEVYASIIIDGATAIPMVTANSLLVIVDHHRPMLSASPELLQAVKKKIIIDHHRRAEDLIKDAILVYLEPLSSSTCELVTELINYFDETLELNASEASALYAGIVVDTKNFAVQTGERTFEAAAYLRRHGADPIFVKKLFRDEQATVIARARLVAESHNPIPGLAISVYEEAPLNDTTQIILAQAADELVNINEIQVSVVMAETTGHELLISARSDGTVNVQTIMEELGGGGHQTVAGVQLKDVKAADIEPQIIALMKEQLEERENNESNSVARS